MLPRRKGTLNFYFVLLKKKDVDMESTNHRMFNAEMEFNLRANVQMFGPSSVAEFIDWLQTSEIELRLTPKNGTTSVVKNISPVLYSNDGEEIETMDLFTILSIDEVVPIWRGQYGKIPEGKDWVAEKKEVDCEYEALHPISDIQDGYTELPF